jgi:hypothetical protein
MPIYTFDLYQKSISAFNTHQRGHMRPNGNFIHWCEEVSMELFREECAEWEKTQVVSDALRPFFRSVNAVVVRVPGRPYGTIAYPADYGYYSSARILTRGSIVCSCHDIPTMNGRTGNGCNPYVDPDEAALGEMASSMELCEVAVKKVPNDKWGAVCDHPTMKPTLKKPKLTIFEGGFKVAPADAAVIVLDYIKLPRKPVFNYTVGPDDQIIYVPAGSVPLEWDESMIPQFLARIGQRYGKYIREPMMYQASTQEKAALK